MTKDWLPHYPEIHATGTLSLALTAALRQQKSTLVTTDLPSSTYAAVEAGHRKVQVLLGDGHRSFSADFYSKGVGLAGGSSQDLDQVATAIHHWITDCDLRAAALSATFPWIAPSAHAHAFENGQGVEWQWDWILKFEYHTPVERAILERASREPRLRMLFPFMSMFTIRFSRCTGSSYTYDLPYITPIGDDLYLVSASEDIELGRGNAETALQLVVNNLPENLGPAWDGTRFDEH